MTLPKVQNKIINTKDICIQLDIHPNPNVWRSAASQNISVTAPSREMTEIQSPE